MDYIVFDLEWNQCPGGKEKENKNLPFEIIEIGAVKLNSQWEKSGEFQEKIRPTVYHSFHHHTQELLHTNMASFRKARTFTKVMKDFFQWCGSDVIFCTWGSQDLLELQRNIRFYHMENPFPFPLYYIDVQKIFSLQLEDGRSRKSLEYAIDFLHIPKALDFHQAFSDAYYTAQIMKQLDRDKLTAYFSIDYLRIPANRKEEILIRYGNYQKLVSQPFHTKNEAIRDRKIASTRCYLCGQPARKKIRWFTDNSKNYYCLAYCQEHGYLKGKARMKKAEDGQFFCVKTLKLIPKEEAEKIMEKKEAVRKKHLLQRKKNSVKA